MSIASTSYKSKGNSEHQWCGVLILGLIHTVRNTQCVTRNAAKWSQVPIAHHTLLSVRSVYVQFCCYNKDFCVACRFTSSVNDPYKALHSGNDLLLWDQKISCLLQLSGLRWDGWWDHGRSWCTSWTRNSLKRWSTWGWCCHHHTTISTHKKTMDEPKTKKAKGMSPRSLLWGHSWGSNPSNSLCSLTCPKVPNPAKIYSVWANTSSHTSLEDIIFGIFLVP